MHATHTQAAQETEDVVDAEPRVDERSSERGMAALVAIWAVLQAVGLDVMEWIRAQLQV